MKPLYYQTVHLKKIREKVLEQSESMLPEHGALVAVYQRLQTLHLSMSKDLVELETLLALSSHMQVAAGQFKNSQKHHGKASAIHLSSKESEVLNIFSKGYSYNETAGILNCKLSTIQTHAKHIYKKLKVHSRSEAVFEAYQLDLIQG